MRRCLMCFLGDIKGVSRGNTDVSFRLKPSQKGFHSCKL